MNHISVKDKVRKDKAGKPDNGQEDFVPFKSVEEAWFWFIAAQQARNEGARFVAGVGTMRRPCEPVDILKVIDRLYRKRRLLRDHLLVLRHYGRRYMAPDLRRVKEQRAHHIWTEALERISPILERKGIVTTTHWLEQAQQGLLFPCEGERA